MLAITDIINPATKAALSTKAAETGNKIPDGAGFIITPEFNRLTKKKKKQKKEKEEKIKQKMKSLLSKSQVVTAIDTALQKKRNN